MSTCIDQDGHHIYRGSYVYAVPGHPQECMECGSPIPLHPRHLVDASHVDGPSGSGSFMDWGIPKPCVDCNRLHVPDTACLPVTPSTHGMEPIRRYWGDSLHPDYL